MAAQGPLQRLASWHTRSVANEASNIARPGGVHGLDQVMVEAGFSTPLLILGLAPAGHRDQQGVFSPRLLADASGQLVAVRLWHADVQERHVEPELGREVESG